MTISLMKWLHTSLTPGCITVYYVQKIDIVLVFLHCTSNQSKLVVNKQTITRPRSQASCIGCLNLNIINCEDSSGNDSSFTLTVNLFRLSSFITSLSYRSCIVSFSWPWPWPETDKASLLPMPGKLSKKYIIIIETASEQREELGVVQEIGVIWYIASFKSSCSCNCFGFSPFQLHLWLPCLYLIAATKYAQK